LRKLPHHCGLDAPATDALVEVILVQKRLIEIKGKKEG
jgi:hypothetical protein